MGDNSLDQLPDYLREAYGLETPAAEKKGWGDKLKEWGGEIAQAAKDTTRLAGRGFQEVQPGLWQTAANTVGLVERAGRAVTGMPEPVAGVRAKGEGQRPSEWLGEKAARWGEYLTEDSAKNREDQAAAERAGLAGKLMKSVFSAGPEVLKYHAGGRLLGAASMPALDAAAAAHEGPEAAAKGALHGLAMHKVLGGVAPYAAPTRMAASGAYAGGLSLAEGASPEDAAIGAITMGALAGEGGGKAGLVNTWKANRADAQAAKARKANAIFEEAAKAEAAQRDAEAVKTEVEGLAERAKVPALPAPPATRTPAVIELPANLAHEKRIAAAQREVASGRHDAAIDGQRPMPRPEGPLPELRETRPGVFEAEEFAPPLELRESAEIVPDYRNYGPMPADVTGALNKADAAKVSAEIKERNRMARELAGIEKQQEKAANRYERKMEGMHRQARKLANRRTEVVGPLTRLVRDAGGLSIDAETMGEMKGGFSGELRDLREIDPTLVRFRKRDHRANHWAAPDRIAALARNRELLPPDSTVDDFLMALRNEVTGETKSRAMDDAAMAAYELQARGLPEWARPPEETAKLDSWLASEGSPVEVGRIQEKKELPTTDSEAGPNNAPKAGGMMHGKTPLIERLEAKGVGFKADEPMGIVRITEPTDVKDVGGQRHTLPKGEEIRSYPLTNGQYLVQDGVQFVANKNQLQALKGRNLELGQQPMGEFEGTQIVQKKQEYPARTQEEYDRLQGEAEARGDWDTSERLTREREGLNAEGSTAGMPKFASYVVPGGENYREILITAPSKEKGLSAREGETLVDALDRQRADNPQFKSSHWDEPNVLAHARLTDRTTPDGKRVLFIEEIQSDWALAGRKMGFSDEAKKLDARRQEIEGKMYGATKEERAEWVQIKKKLEQIKGGVPSHPYLKNWQENTLRRVLKMAAEEGYDGVAWTSGKQQAERYDLSRQVDRIEVVPRTDARTGEKTRAVTIMLKEGVPSYIELGVDNRGIIDNATTAGVQGKALADVIGKAAADKAMQSDKQTFYPKDMALGSEWATNLYDKQIPNILNDLTRKAGGKVETKELDVPYIDEAGTESPASSVQGYLELTPQLREIILTGGQPMAGGRVWGGELKGTGEEQAAQLAKALEENRAGPGGGATTDDFPELTKKIGELEAQGRLVYDENRGISEAGQAGERNLRPEVESSGVGSVERALAEKDRLAESIGSRGKEAQEKLEALDALVTDRQNPALIRWAQREGIPDDIVLRMLSEAGPKSAGEEMRQWGRKNSGLPDAEWDAGISDIARKHYGRMKGERGAAAPDLFVAPLVNPELVKSDVQRVGKLLKTIWQANKHPEVVQRVVDEYDAGHRQAEYQAYLDANKLAQLIPDKAMRESLPFLAEKARLEGRPVEDVIPLLAHDGWRFMRQRYDQLHQVLTDMHPDVGFVQDFVSRLWEKPNEVLMAWDAEIAAKPGSNTRLMQTSGHERKRSIPTLEWGLAHGFKPRTTDVATLLQHYERGVLQQLSRWRTFNAMYKAGMVLPSDLAPEGKGWRHIDDKSLTRHLPDYTNGWSVAPQAADAVKVMVDRGFQSKIAKAALGVQAFYKRSVFDLSGFHLVALLKSAAAAPSAALPWNIHKSYKRFKAGDKVVREAIDAGVTLNSPYDVGAEVLDGIVGALHKGARGAGARVPLLKPLQIGTWALAKVSRGTQFVLWDWAYTGLKVGSYERFRDAMTEKYGDRYDAKTIQRWAGEATNDFFGGINQTRMFRSKSFQQTMRLILNAPDWAEANFRSVFGAARGLRDIKKGEVKQGLKDTWARGIIHRKYWRNVMVALWAIGSAINYKNTEDEEGGGRVLGQNPGDRAFDVYLGKDEETGEDRYLDIFGFLKDNYRMMIDPSHYIYGKLAGAPKLALDVLQNEDWRGDAIAPSYMDMDEKAAKLAGHVGKSFLPISVQSQIDAEEQGQSRLDALSGSFGFPVKKQRYATWGRMKRDLMNEKDKLRRYIGIKGKKIEAGDMAAREDLIEKVKEFNRGVDQMLTKAAKFYANDPEISRYKGLDDPDFDMETFGPAFIKDYEVDAIYQRRKERKAPGLSLRGL